MTAQSEVVVHQDGNGGAITYTEPGVELRFTWEFAMPPSIALIFGPLGWNQLAEAPIERKVAIYRRLGSEVVRQRAPGGEYVLDLDRGIIDILRAR